MAHSHEERKVLVDPDTGKQYPIGGCIISNEPSRLPQFGNSIRTLSDADTPEAVDLRQLMTPVEDQGNMNSCVGNALAGAYEFLIMKNHKKHVDVSRFFIYYNGRSLDGVHQFGIKDDGTTISAAIEGLKKFGCCKEELFPYSSVNVNKKPPEQCYKEGVKHRIQDAATVNANLSEMRACLAQGFPFAFGIQTFSSFLQAGTNGGRVPMPNLPYEQQNSQHGWHAMLAVGYSDKSKCFIVRNSWKDTWGDKGYCYIPYDYMANPQHCRDLHVIKMVEDDADRRGRTNVVNPYDWNVDKDKYYYIPPQYFYPDFDYTFFWKLHDNFNYFKFINVNGQVAPFVWKSPGNRTNDRNNEARSVSPHRENKRSFILWMDRKSNESTRIEQQLNRNSDVRIDFADTYTHAEEHLLRNKNKINKPSSKFLIICRGFYREENKNPIDLLQFLDRHGLSHIPVIAFTQDKSGLMGHLERQASSMRLNDWRQRVFVTSSSEELIRKVQEKTDDDHGSYYR